MGDSRRNLGGTAGPLLAPFSFSPPFVQSDPIRLGCPAFSLLRLLLVSSPCAPVVESSCPMSFDSRFCRGSFSTSFQSRLSILRLPLPLLYSLLLAYTLPRPLAWLYEMASPHPSAPPIVRWLIE